MHLPPGMEWDDQAVTMMYYARDNNITNFTNGSDIGLASVTGATIASPIAMFLAGVIGNLLALWVLHRTRLESQRLMFHSLVACLVWNDLIGIVLTSPVTIASYINDLQMPGGEHLCKFNGFVMICFGLSTPLIVSAMAIERFLFVKYTFFYTKHCAPGAARVVILVIWGFVLFFGLLPMFGFGDYVLQYPRTWCFLDFRTTNPVHAAYGYLYSSLNLLLVLVMVVCNLVVVATLARVRDFRRKYSTTSLNSVLIGDGAIDDTARQQAIARRRKQKDIELQMIVVMCAITTIFAVCWSPLMIYISVTLGTGGQTRHVLGLVSVRLASINQTLNPWLYVILRRTLIIRIKKLCCRWKRLLRKKSTQSPVPVGRRHQYVHVRNQLCHRSNFVGGDIDNNSLTDSLRKSLAQAIPAAMSLPDVMMVNTGRKDLDIPMPDVAKAQSFAGRVSHSYSFGSMNSCVYCNAPILVECAECFRERYGKESDKKLFRLIDHDTYDSEECPKCPNNTIASEGDYGVKFTNGQIVYTKEIHPGDSKYDKNEDSDYIYEKPSIDAKDANAIHALLKRDDNDSNHSGKNKGNETSKGHKKAPLCSKHSGTCDLSSGKRENRVENSSHPSSTSISESSKKKMGKERFPLRSVSIRSTSSYSHGRSGDSRLSQHMHKPRNSSRSSVSGKSSKTSSSREKQSRHSTSIEGPNPCNGGSENQMRRRRRTESAQSGQQDFYEVLSDDSKDDGDVFMDNDDTILEMRKDTTTDDCGFSSLPTDSVYLSESGAIPSDIRLLKANHSSLQTKPGLTGASLHQDFPTATQPALIFSENTESGRLTKPAKMGGMVNHSFNEKPKDTLVKPKRESHHNKRYDRTSSGSTSYLLREHSDEDGSSGIFSAESPARSSRDMGPQSKWDLKKESQSEVLPEGKADDKLAARRVKSYN